jgi:hypothetical protein
MDSAPPLLDPLGSIRDEWDACVGRAKAVCAGLEPADLARRKDPARWSIAENLEHLTITAQAYLPILDRAAAELRERGARSDGPYSLDVPGRFLLWMLRPPYRVRVKAPAAFLPAAIERPEEVLARYLQAHADLAARLDALRGFALDRHKIGSPFNARFRYSVWSALKLIGGHERRHLWVCEQLRTK